MARKATKARSRRNRGETENAVMSTPRDRRAGASPRAHPGQSRRRGSAPRGAERVGAAQVSEVQRARILTAAAEVVGERGYGGMSVARVTGRAGVSRRTFYDLF